jgi:hypothetical protein
MNNIKDVNVRKVCLVVFLGILPLVTSIMLVWILKYTNIIIDLYGMVVVSVLILFVISIAVHTFYGVFWRDRNIMHNSDTFREHEMGS